MTKFDYQPSLFCNAKRSSFSRHTDLSKVEVVACGHEHDGQNAGNDSFGFETFEEVSKHASDVIHCQGPILNLKKVAMPMIIPMRITSHLRLDATASLGQR